MRPEDLERLNAAFDRIVEAPTSVRGALIIEAAAGNEEFARRLGALLRNDDSAGTPLDASLDRLVSNLLSDPAEFPAAGPWRLLNEVGRGGMGVVYVAERSAGEFEQRAAIKIVKRGMDTDEVLRRFHKERQILANLEHPNIARLLDGGVTSDGRPYLAMEFIEGRRITAWADAHRLPLSERLHIFRDACEAVRYAHQNLVVHRDIKPSNILVMDDGTVKLLDFGIAKLLDRGSEELTRPEARILTPGYAAPEQLDGRPVTTSTDVYGLGVVLHELLTGHKPTGSGTTSLPSRTVFADRASPEAEGESGTRTALEVSVLRGTTPNRLRTALRGDLDAILLKALAAEPERRYPSVDALLEDLDRHRSARPVSARLPTAGYRLGRFLRRNWAPLASAAAVLLSLTSGLAVALQQRNLARQERDAAETVTAYLEGMFESVNPVGRQPGADTLRVVDFLERSTDAALTDLAGRPALQARLLRTLGRAHFALFDFERARDLWGRAREAHEAASESPTTDLLRDLGEVSIELADWDAADSLLSQAIERARDSGPDAALARGLSLRARAALYRDDFATAEAALREAIPLLRELDRPQELAEALYLKAGLHHERGETDAATAAQREGLEIFRRERGDDAQAAVGLTNLGVMLVASGRTAEADSAFSQALAILRVRTPPGSSPQLVALTEYANLLSTTGRPARADSLYEEAASQLISTGDRRRLVVVLANQGQHRRRHGDPQGALSLSRRAVRVADEVYGVGTLGTVPVRTGLGLALDAVGDSAAAEDEYGAVAEILRRAGGGPLNARIIAERGVARGWSREGRHVEAERELLRLLDLTPPDVPEGGALHRTRQATLRELARVYERWGRSGDAAGIRAQLDDQGDPPE